jgi:hypothetical protein
MTTQFETIAQTALSTAAALAPTLAAGDPKLAAIVAATPLAIQLLQAATQLTQAGVMPPDQLSALWFNTAQNLSSTHNAWAAMNAADSAKA